MKVLPQFETHRSLEIKEIIIFGFGRLGKRVVDFALSRGYTILEIWDNYPKCKEYLGIKVCKPHSNYDKGTVIIISAIIADINKILSKQAQNLDYYNILDYAEIFVGQQLSYDEYCLFLNDIQRFRIKKLYHNKKNIVALSHMDFQITERCTLKCKECSSLMQYYVSPKDLDVEEALETIDKLLSSVDYIERIHILGGEPFMCKELYRYVETLKKYNNVGIIGIITNATILPKGKNLECLKSDKVQVRISDYGKLSLNIAQLVTLLKREHIFYSVLSVDNWYKCSGFEKHDRTDDENKKILSDCIVAKCYTLRNKRIFHCPFTANAWALQSIPQDYIEYVDLSSENAREIRQKLKAYLCKDILKACDYCTGRPLIGCEPTQVAEQVSKPVMYKKYL